MLDPRISCSVGGQPELQFLEPKTHCEAMMGNHPVLCKCPKEEGGRDHKTESRNDGYSPWRQTHCEHSGF